jgi:hypothetical protein
MPVLRVIAYIVIPAGAALLLLIAGHGEAGVIVLTVSVLIVTTILLQAATIGPAELSVQRQHELGYSDWIFYLTTEAPRDILLQMHVAIINTGGRKGVLSKLELQEFLDEAGVAVRPYQMPFPLAARVFRQSEIYGFAGGRSIRQTRVETSSPPVILEPDDVITLQFRNRRGIDWTPRWTLDEIRQLTDSLERAIVKARMTVTFRRGREVVIHDFEVPVECLQQADYVAKLRELTNNSSLRPVIPEQPFEIE